LCVVLLPRSQSGARRSGSVRHLLARVHEDAAKYPLVRRRCCQIPLSRSCRLISRSRQGTTGLNQWPLPWQCWFSLVAHCVRRRWHWWPRYDVMHEHGCVPISGKVCASVSLPRSLFGAEAWVHACRGFLGNGLVAAPSPWRLCPCDHLGVSCRQQGSTQSHALVKAWWRSLGSSSGSMAATSLLYWAPRS
jgi:hypothetical protein